MKDELLEWINLYWEEKYYIFLALVYVLSVVTSVMFVKGYSGDDKSIEFDYESVERNENIYVEISGAVEKPGVYKLSSDARLVELLSLGGGVSQNASEEFVSRNINLSSTLNDSQKVYIPFKWESEKSEEFDIGTIQRSLVAKETGALETDTIGSENKININSASAGELESLKGIGPTYSQRIEENRPYTDVAELKEKVGLPSSTLEKIVEYISF